VDAITHEDVARLLGSKAARTTLTGAMKKATSANPLRTSRNVFFGCLHRAGITERDAGRLIRREIGSAGPPKTPTAAEQKRLRDRLAQDTGFEAERDRVLFTLMLQTGSRVGSGGGPRRR
jgi:site-specific recombinase XerD